MEIFAGARLVPEGAEANLDSSDCSDSPETVPGRVFSTNRQTPTVLSAGQRSSSLRTLGKS